MFDSFWDAITFIFSLAIIIAVIAGVVWMIVSFGILTTFIVIAGVILFGAWCIISFIGDLLS